MDNELSSTLIEASRWARVRSALADCLELTGPARAAFIARLRQTDPAIAAEVDELAAIDDQTGSVLDRSPDELVGVLAQAREVRQLEGTRLGAYRIVRRIASGGMGEVFLGERDDGAFRMQVAIKLLREGLVDAADIARFERERQTLANLEHVNLVKILDGGVTESGLPYFVMELIAGAPLDAHCDRIGATLEQRIGLLRQVCEVVHYVNQHGIVHRDLKPSNILVTPAGVVKLVDFGIAARLPDPAGAVEQTRTAMRGMTLLYASPEQIRGGPVGAWSDVYALGVVMVRLLASGQPYAVDTANASAFEFAKAICELEPRAMSELVADGPGARARRRALRGDLDAIAAKALRKDPAARYATAAELDEDLFRHLSFLPVQARRGALNYRFGRWLLKHRAFAGAAIVTNLVLLVGIAVTLAEVHEARLQRERADRNFASVRTLTNDFLFDLNDAIASLPGSMPARKLVVEKAQLYLKTLAADAASDRSVALDLGISYRKIGELQDRPGEPNLGDADGALANFARSIAILEPLAAGRPDTANAELDRAQLALAQTRLAKGSVLSASGKFDAAQQALDESGAGLAPLLRRDPGNDAARRMQASIYGNLSWVRHEKGDLAGFEKYAGLSEGMLEKILAEHPADIDARNRLQNAYARRTADYLDRTTDTEANAHHALDYALRWVDIGKQLLAQSPTNPHYRAVLAEASAFVGAAYDRLGDAKRSAEAIEQGIAQTTEELRLEPDDDAALEMMVNLHGTLAKALLGQHQPDAVREHVAQALAFYDRRSATARASTYNLLEAVQVHHVAGHAWLQVAERDHADPARARADRAHSCEEFLASAELARGVKEVPQTGGDDYDLPETLREAAACRAHTS